MQRLLIAVILLAAAMAMARPLCAFAQGPDASEETLHEIFRLRLVNDRGGAIAVSRDAGRSWQMLGQVLQYTTRINKQGFTASKWVPPGRVAATAVNAIHINVGYDPEEDRGAVLSVLPREFLSPPTGYDSYLSPDASIYTDLPAGESIFGGGEAPFVGSPMYREEDGRLVALEAGYVPAQGDVLVAIVARPARYPLAAVLENREGGAITLQYADGSQRLLGWIIKPVRGIGRFLGSRYAGIGRIRANHAGVIDVSTSPTGFLGGFQIIPVGHALSPELELSWRMTQWMIVGPVETDSPLWGGLMPLFYQHLRPDYRPDDLCAEEWQGCLLARFLVEVDMGEGWGPLPALRLSPDPGALLPQWADHALEGVKRVRLLFPLAERETTLETSAGGCAQSVE